MTSHRAREKNYEWHRQNPGAPDAYGKDEYGKVAPPEWRTLKFYQHHKFYRLLGVEYDATRDQIKARGKKLMRYLNPASERYQELYQAMSCLVYGYHGERTNYDRHGDIQPLHSLHVPAAEGQQEPWYDRRPSEYRLPKPQILDRWNVFEFRKELARLPSTEDAKGAASGKLSTQNQFGFARTWNPYSI